MYAPKKIIGYLMPVVLFSLIAGCSGGGPDYIPPDDDLDVEPFIEYAEDADCTDLRNRLFLIDDELVFWDRAGSCQDAAYEYQLYGDSLDDLLCEAYDTINGPQENIYDEDYRELFEVITENLEEEHLGLDDSHSVEEIIF